MSTPRINPVTEPLTGPLAEQMARLIPAGMAAPQLFLSVARNAGLFGFLVDSGLIGPTGLLDRRILADRPARRTQTGRYAREHARRARPHLRRSTPVLQ